MGFTPVTKCVWNVQMFPSGNWEPIRCNTSSPRGGLNVLSGPIHKITNKHTHTAPRSRPRAGNVAQSPADGQSPRPLPELRGLGAGLGWGDTCWGQRGPAALRSFACCWCSLALARCHIFCWRWSERALKTVGYWVLTACRYPRALLPRTKERGARARENGEVEFNWTKKVCVERGER